MAVMGTYRDRPREAGEAATCGHHRHLGRPAQLLQGREVEQGTGGELGVLRRSGQQAEVTPSFRGIRHHQRNLNKHRRMVDGGEGSCRDVIDSGPTWTPYVISPEPTFPIGPELIKRNVDRYVKDEIGGQQRALERLRQVIHNEETELRDGEDWSVAKDYVRSLQNMISD